MDLQSANSSEARFEAYVEGLVSVIGHKDRAGPLRDYCVGLVMPGERKSVEPMAAVTAPARTAAGAVRKCVGIRVAQSPVRLSLSDQAATSRG